MNLRLLYFLQFLINNERSTNSYFSYLCVLRIIACFPKAYLVYREDIKLFYIILYYIYYSTQYFIPINQKRRNLCIFIIIYYIYYFVLHYIHHFVLCYFILHLFFYFILFFITFIIRPNILFQSSRNKKQSTEI